MTTATKRPVTMQRVLHERFVWWLHRNGNPVNYTDGGPSDLNRVHKRAAAKRQRQARRIQRRRRP